MDFNELYFRHRFRTRRELGWLRFEVYKEVGREKFSGGKSATLVVRGSVNGQKSRTDETLRMVITSSQ